jgi:hypothetical protein
MRNVVFWVLVTANVVPSSRVHSTLKMVETLSSKTWVLTRLTRRHIPEDGILYVNDISDSTEAANCFIIERSSNFHGRKLGDLKNIGSIHKNVCLNCKALSTEVRDWNCKAVPDHSCAPPAVSFATVNCEGNLHTKLRATVRALHCCAPPAVSFATVNCEGNVHTKLRATVRALHCCAPPAVSFATVNCEGNVHTKLRATVHALHCCAPPAVSFATVNCEGNVHTKLWATVHALHCCAPPAVSFATVNCEGNVHTKLWATVHALHCISEYFGVELDICDETECCLLLLLVGCYIHLHMFSWPKAVR